LWLNPKVEIWVGRLNPNVGKQQGGNFGATLARVKNLVEPAQPKFLKKETG